MDKYTVISVQFNSVSQSCLTLQSHRLQHGRLPCPSPTVGACSNSCPLNRWSIQQSHPLSSASPPAFNLSQHQGLFKWGSSSHQVAKELRVSASTSVLPINILGWFPLGLTGLICNTRDSEESSPTPQFKSINSLALNFLYSPTLTSIHDYWKKS